MSRAVRFSATDLTRAVKAMEKAGCLIGGAQIKPDGTIVVLTAAPGGIPANDLNPLDRLHRHG